MLVLGIVAGVAIPRFGNMHESAKVAATKTEMQRLKSAILGTQGTDGTPRGGFELDVGHPPNRLLDLAKAPDSLAAWSPFSGRGWNGPYMSSEGGEFLRDAWDSTYQFDCDSRTITSIGSGSNIVLSF